MGSYIHFFLSSQNIVRNQLGVNVRNRRANSKVANAISHKGEMLTGVLNKSRSKAALVTPEKYVSLYIPHKKRVSERASPRVMHIIRFETLAKSHTKTLTESIGKALGV